MTDTNTFFAALANDIRLRCLVLMQLEGELCVCELTHAMNLSQPMISRHLALLRESGLVETRRDGQWMVKKNHSRNREGQCDGNSFCRRSVCLKRHAKSPQRILLRVKSLSLYNLLAEDNVMKRFHIHISVSDLDKNIAFYSQVFNSEPSIVKGDYAKWALDDPALNFAISTRGSQPGLDHVGIQTDSDEELSSLRTRLESAGIQGIAQENATCCYARSDKYWVQDPQGIAWETFHSLASVPVFSEQNLKPSSDSACCAPGLPSSGANCC